jgi:hypothetical protein
MYLSVLPLSLGIASITASPLWWSVRPRASRRGIKPAYETFDAVIRSTRLGTGDCRASWRGVPVFRVAGGTFKLLQQPRVAISSCTRWPWPSGLGSFGVVACICRYSSAPAARRTVVGRPCQWSRAAASRRVFVQFISLSNLHARVVSLHPGTVNSARYREKEQIPHEVSGL